MEMMEQRSSRLLSPLGALVWKAMAVICPMLSAALTGPVITVSASSRWNVMNAPSVLSADTNIEAERFNP